MISRRSFLAATSSVLVMGSRNNISGDERKKVAFLGTVVRTHSHAQHFLDRLTQGYAWASGWQKPRVDVASVFIDQFPKDDLAHGRVKKQKLDLYPTIAEALTLGTSKLAVDGVVIIAEHGNYPRNEKGQTLYPRYDWFKQVVKIFEDSGRSVPVFNDKHLSTNWKQAREMVDDSKRLGFEFLAGSSLPVTWRLPCTEMPHGVPLKESVAVAYGGVDSYDFHALETAQCMSERRAGGEVGISSVHALRGEELWEKLGGSGYDVTRNLMVAALNRSHSLPVDTGYPSDAVTFDWARRVFPNMLAYIIEHRDGLRTTMFLAPIMDFNYAGMRSDSGEIISCQMYLPMPGRAATTADFFNPLTRHIESLVIDDHAAYPAERTLLTSGMVIGGVDSLHAGQVRIETPDMAVKYAVSGESFFRRV